MSAVKKKLLEDSLRLSTLLISAIEVEYYAQGPCNKLYHGIKLLLSRGADPLKPSPKWNCNALHQAAFTCKEKTFQLVRRYAGPTAGEMTPELTQLRGCYHLKQGQCQAAYDRFFDDGETFAGNELRIWIRYYELMSQFVDDTHLCTNAYDYLVRSNTTLTVPILEHVLRETDIPYHCIPSTAIRQVDICPLLQLLTSEGHTNRRTSEDLQFLYNWIGEVCYFSNVGDEEQLNRTADIVSHCSFKNQLLMITDFNPSLLAFLRFLIVNCRCNPIERNRFTNRSLASYFSDYYTEWQTAEPDLSSELREMMELLVAKGAHFCQPQYAQIVIEAPTRNKVKWYEREPRTLECLAASVIARAQIEVSELTEMMQKFVLVH